jgi:hypothetical protein
MQCVCRVASRRLGTQNSSDEALLAPLLPVQHSRMQESIIQILKGNIAPFWAMKMFSRAVFAHFTINTL